MAWLRPTARRLFTDLKPDNIFLEEVAGHFRVKLVDFGISVMLMSTEVENVDSV